MAITSANWEKLIRRFGSARDRASTVGEAYQEHTDSATRVWLYSSVVWLTVVDLFGLILATELRGDPMVGVQPYPASACQRGDLPMVVDDVLGSLVLYGPPPDRNPEHVERAFSSLVRVGL